MDFNFSEFLVPKIESIFLTFSNLILGRGRTSGNYNVFSIKTVNLESKKFVFTSSNSNKLDIFDLSTFSPDVFTGELTLGFFLKMLENSCENLLF